MNLFIGGVVVDQIVRIPEMPKWDVTEYISEYSVQQGGMAATAAVACAKLGEYTEFIGGVGDDENGQLILNNFAVNNVKKSRVKIFTNEQSAFSICLVHHSTGKRTILHNTAVQRNSDLVSEINLSGIENVHIDGYWFKSVLPLIKAASDKKINVIIDPSTKLLRNREELELLNFADYIIPNFKFASQLTNETDPYLMCKKLFHSKCKAVIVTNGKDGCYLYTTGKYMHIPAFQIDAVDTTGAGDVFHGAFVAGISKNFDVEFNCKFSSAAAAIKCLKAGGQSGISDFNTVMSFIKQH